jgi:pyruvate dehydrogenase E2 component (dihydrolipoamide acetyltransferase)
MPKWGLTMKQGKITRWFKSEGEAIQEGEPFFEVETEKITNTVEAEASGVVFQIVVSAGETVAVGSIVAIIARPGEQPQRIEAGLRDPTVSPTEAEKPQLDRSHPCGATIGQRFWDRFNHGSRNRT